MRSRLLLQQKETTRLTGNERKVLRMLLTNSRISDVDIGAKLRITSQAASKIRKKLERLGIIKDYFVDLDYAALGINTFALCMLQIAPFESGIERHLDSSLHKHLVGFYRVFKNDVTHIGLFGFRNLGEMDRYFRDLHNEHASYFTIKDMYVFPVQSMFKHSHNDLFNTIIKEFGKEQMPVPPQIRHYADQKKNSNEIRLSQNERKILHKFITDSKTSYRKLATDFDDLDITSRGISKIKDRLEHKGVIRGYSTRLDYEKLGVKIFAFMFIHKKVNGWKLEDSLCKLALQSYNVLGCYQMSKDSLHVLCCAFRNLSELEHYYNLLQIRNKELFDINKIYISSAKGVLKDYPTDLFKGILA